STSADEVIAVDVVERLLANPSTRYAWLLGFLTGSALADGPLGPPAPAVKAAEGA
ncbi:MAG: hypothetical protein QOK05_764, partial [Chloroflexota bacterium]|nr:hypothetical protein [Chloroflexota bacterium]